MPYRKLYKRGRSEIGVKGDYLVGVLGSVFFGIGEWFLIPMLGFSDTIKYLGAYIEAPCIALMILWLIRVARRH